MAERIQRRRTKGWRMPEGAVYVGRPSLWGNPYSLDDVRVIYPEVPPSERAAAAVRLYRRELGHFGLLSDYAYTVPGRTIEAADRRWEAVRQLVDATGAQNMAEYAAVALRGKTLVCWCPLDQPCHADVLLELAA
jgi:hypothetical protein